MTPQILYWLESLPLHSLGNVLEIGSWDVNGSPRTPLMPLAKSWTGVDLLPGPSVDVVMDAKQFLSKVDKGQFDTVVACEVYEHDPRFWETNEAVKRILPKGGIYIITSPTISFPLHEDWNGRSFGGDFYRFTESGIKFLFGDRMQVLEVTTVGDHPCLCACGVAKMLYPEL